MPNKNIAFEFQDSYHYISTWYSQVKLETIQQKDNVKKELTQQIGLSLIVVPCWWDGKIESLSSSILFQRPDLINNTTNGNQTIITKEESELIPLNPPHDFFPRIELPDIGELMLASFPTSTDFSMTIPENSWWMGEKYDGVRCCWNSFKHKMYTRSGRDVNLLFPIELSLPNIFIDGEFWFGRGMYLLTSMLYKGSVDFVEWNSLRIMCFDVPSIEYRHLPFEKRYELLIQKTTTTHPVLSLAYRTLCRNNKHLLKATKEIIENSGEGIILRKINSLYEPGRTPSLIKFKTVYGDKEGLVVEVAKELVKLKLANGHILSVPMLNVFIPSPSKGDIVTFSYEVNARRELPVNPKIVKKRTDVSWEDVLISHMNEQQFLNDESSQTKGFTAHAQGYWTIENMKQYLVDFAKKFNLDPLLSSTWYAIPHRAVYRSRCGRAIHKKFESYAVALQSIFPNIGLDIAKLSQVVWNNLKNRRYFFEKYASSNKFDPLNPAEWYQQTPEKIMQEKDASKVIAYHNNSLPRALHDLFPEIGFQRSELLKLSWQNKAARRKFFENYASNNQFDPLDPGKWYLQSKDSIWATKGANSVLYYYGGSIAKALIDLFPDVGLEKIKLSHLQFSNTEQNYTPLRRNFFNNKFRRKKQFELYATENGFDPLIADNWYAQSRRKIVSYKGISTIVSYFNGSLTKALMDAFPEIGLQQSLFPWNRAHWSNPANRRKFFEDYANVHHFNFKEPGNWYLQTKENILNTQGAKQVLYYHENNVALALLSLFPSIGLDKLKLLQSFSYPTRGFVSVLKDLLIEYAKQQLLDPNSQLTWYSQKRSEIMNAKDIAAIIKLKFSGSVTNALLACFPEIGLDPAKLPWSQSSWKSGASRRKFFIDYATLHNFSYLSAENWYNTDIQTSLTTQKGAQSVFSYHGRSLSQALIELFPEIHFDISKFDPWNDLSNRRKVFEKYATTNGFNYLIAENWYAEPLHTLKQAKDMSKVLKYHNDNVPQALIELFPEVNFEIDKFKYNGLWASPFSRRKYFEEFAISNNFDPLIADNWFLHTKDFKELKGARTILNYYNDSLYNSLQDLFPEIEWHKSESYSKLWRISSNRRRFFEKYANDNGFDPLIPHNWYAESKANIIQAKGVHGVLYYYNNSITQALLDSFPEIGLEKDKFDRAVWAYPANRRQFFEKYAKQNKFDPLSPSNWYSQSHKKIMLTKGAHRVVYYHNNSVSQALIELFPEIDLNLSLFTWLKQKFA